MNRSITAAWQAVAGSSTLLPPPSSSEQPSSPAAMGGKRRNQNTISLNSPLPAHSPSSTIQQQQQLQNGSGTYTVIAPPGSAAAAMLARQQQPASTATKESSSTSSPRPQPTAEETSKEILSDAQIVAQQQASSSSSTLAASPTSPSVNGTLLGKRTKRSSATTSTNGLSSKRGKTSSSTLANKGKYAPPDVRFSSLGGISKAIEQCLELIALPLLHPEIYTFTGIVPPRGILLHGPPGCGKTRLAQALCGEMNVPFLNVSAPSIVSGTSGESEKGLRDLFEEAKKLAPCIVFLDEIDAITPKRENAQREMERRIVAQLLTCLDDLAWEKNDGKPVMVIGATNRPDSLDPALRRAGRFDHEITLGVPDEEGREQILRVLSNHLRLSGNFDFTALAKATPGYVGADLTALTSTAGIVAVKRIFQALATGDEVANAERAAVETAAADTGVDVEMQTGDDGDGSAEELQQQQPSQPTTTSSSNLLTSLPNALQNSTIASFLRRYPSQLSESHLSLLSITNEDFKTALPLVQPSSKREGFATVPDVSWSDIGALHETREELSMAIVQPIRRPELFAAVGVSASSGVMLWGPPGCGKTLLAKAVANESRANFISVKGPELLNKYVGESERAVRQVFARARASSPCVIFFDELDALVPKRDDMQGEVASRVVNTLLTELDGLEGRGQTYVIAATNRPDRVDPAMCRPGRLDKLLYVDLPKPHERLDILLALTKKSPLLTQEIKQQVGDGLRGSVYPVDLERIAHDPRADRFSGADLAALVREAAVTALREAISFSLTAEAVILHADQKPTGTAPPQVYVGQEHFFNALDKIRPSVTTAQLRRYQSLRTSMAGAAIAPTPIQPSQPQPDEPQRDVAEPALA